VKRLLLCVLPPDRKGGVRRRAPRKRKCECEREWCIPIEAFRTAISPSRSEGKRHSWIQLGVNGAISRLGARRKSIRSRHRLCDTDFWIGHCRRSITRKELYGRSSFLHNISPLKSTMLEGKLIYHNTPTISAAVQFWCIFNYDAWEAVISFRV
jgi:hypothetical protein